jgi:dipeptidyl aminopeptidase/acylaminoacyl peptidase
MNRARYLMLWLVLAAAIPFSGPRGAGAGQSRFLTVDDVINMESADEFHISPDGNWVVWIKKVPNAAKNKHNRHIYLTATKEDRTFQLTRGDVDDRSPQFSPDGSRVAFLSARGEKAKRQIYLLNLNGGEAQKLTNVEMGVNQYEWLNEGKILYAAREDSTLRERKLATDKDDVVVVADQRHFGPARLFEFDIESKKSTRLTANSGVISSFAVSPDGRWVVTNEQQNIDYPYDHRVPPKQFLIDREDRSRKEVFEQPHVDPYDFKWAADSKGFFCRRNIASDSTDTYVSISKLYYYELAENSFQPVEIEWENGLGRSYCPIKGGVVAALADGTVDRIAYVTAGSGADRRGGNSVTLLQTERPVRLAAAARGGTRVVYVTSDASSIPDVMTATVDRGRLENGRRLIQLNESLREKTLARSEIIRWAGAGGDTVEGVLYYPVDFDTAFSFPLVAVIHGGPSGSDPDFFTERWSNYPHVLASKGTFVLKVNYHGSGNYGLEWLESIKGRYYELEVPDIINGIDFLVAGGNVDDGALGIMGWSNGSILAIACCLETDRFKALCAGAGDVNWSSDYGNCAFGAAFDNAYLGGPPWEFPQVYLDKSPLFRIQDLKTPTLIMFGSEDKSVPTEQGWQHFRAMQQVGAAPVRFLLFPGSGHGLVKLSHQKRKMQEELAWFDQHLFNTYVAKNEAFDDQSPLARAIALARVEKVGYLIGQEVDATILPEIVELNGIRLSRFEITRAQFGAFDPNYTYPPGTDNYPVNNISLPLAQAYCIWLSEKLNGKFRLPTEAEMDTLLASANSNLTHENNLDYWLGYSPTPDELEMVRSKINELEKTRLLIEPVGRFRPVAGRNGEGVYDLGGNVSEWVVGDSGQGMIKGLSAVSPIGEREESVRPHLSYVGFRVVQVR